MASLRPIPGQWYQALSDNTIFEVIAWDKDSLTIDVQYLDGEIAEYDLEAWQQTALAPAAPPEDWRTPFELDGDDERDPDAPYHPEDYNPIASIEPEYIYDTDEP